jgi:hypothetical protein
MAGEFNMDPDDARFNWTGGTEEEAAEPEGEPEAPAAPTLDDLDEETRGRVEAYYAHQETLRRERMQASGLDLTGDGKVVVADPNRFAAWSGLATPSRQQAASPPPPVPPAVPEEEPISLDPITMTGQELQAAIDKMVSRQIAPLVQQNQELRGQLQRRSAREAVAGVRQALEQYAPEIAGITDHPDFAEQYRLQAEAMDPRALEDPRLVAAMAANLRPYLQASPNTPPGWSPARPAQQPPQEQPRDTQGRFTEVARNMTNRQNIGQVPQARGGMAPPQPRDAAARETQQFLDEFKNFAQGRVSKKTVNTADADATDFSDYAEWQNAMKAAGNGARR